MHASSRLQTPLDAYPSRQFPLGDILGPDNLDILRLVGRPLRLFRYITSGRKTPPDHSYIVRLVGSSL